MARRFSRLPAEPPGEARIWTLKMAPADIGYVNSIIEAYEGLGLARTTDNKAGIMEVWVMPGFEEDFRVIAASLAAETGLEVLEKERPICDPAES